jgi:hypothetical protein
MVKWSEIGNDAIQRLGSKCQFATHCRTRELNFLSAVAFRVLCERHRVRLLQSNRVFTLSQSISSSLLHILRFKPSDHNLQPIHSANLSTQHPQAHPKPPVSPRNEKWLPTLPQPAPGIPQPTPPSLHLFLTSPSPGKQSSSLAAARESASRSQSPSPKLLPKTSSSSVVELLFSLLR